MARRLPSPVNQFNRLLHTGGIEPTGSYALGSRWNNISHGTNWDAFNCTAAMGALLIDADSGGTKHTTPAGIRNHQLDFNGGIGWSDVNLALWNLFSTRLTIPSAFDWYDVLSALRDGHAVGIQGNYAYVPQAYQWQVGGTFDHAFALAGYRSSDGRVLRYDPLGKQAAWIPQSAIRPAAEALSRRVLGTPARLFTMVTQAMPELTPSIPPVTYRYGGEPRYRGRYLARRDDVPVRSRPDPTAPQVATLAHRQDFACRQSALDGRWLGNSTGTKWVYRDVMWYSGRITGNEVIE